jgi:hypothetical protein
MPDPFDVSGGGDYSDSAYGGFSSEKKKRTSGDVYSPGLGVGLSGYAGLAPSPQRSRSYRPYRGAVPSAYRSSASPGRRSLTNPYDPSAPLRSFAEPALSAVPRAPDMPPPSPPPTVSPYDRVTNPLLYGPTAPPLVDTSLYASPEARFPVGSVGAAPIGWENPFFPGAGVSVGRAGGGARGGSR